MRSVTEFAELSINLLNETYNQAEPFMNNQTTVEDFVKNNASTLNSKLQQNLIDTMSLGCQSSVLQNILVPYWSIATYSIFAALSYFDSLEYEDYLPICSKDVCGCGMMNYSRNYFANSSYIGYFNAERELQLCFFKVAIASMAPCMDSMGQTRSRILSSDFMNQIQLMSFDEMNTEASELLQSFYNTIQIIEKSNNDGTIRRIMQDSSALLPKGTFKRSINETTNTQLTSTLNTVLDELDQNSSTSDFRRICFDCASYKSLTDILTEKDREMYMYCSSVYVVAMASKSNPPCNRVTEQVKRIDNTDDIFSIISWNTLHRDPPVIYNEIANGLLGYDADYLFQRVNESSTCFNLLNTTYKQNLTRFCSSLSLASDGAEECAITTVIDQGSSLTALVVCCVAFIVFIFHLTYLFSMDDISIQSTLKLLCLVDLSVIFLCNPWVALLELGRKYGSISKWLFTQTTDPSKYLAAELLYSVGWAAFYVGYNIFLINIQVRSQQNLDNATKAKEIHEANANSRNTLTNKTSSSSSSSTAEAAAGTSSSALPPSKVNGNQGNLMKSEDKKKANAYRRYLDKWDRFSSLYFFPWLFGLLYILIRVLVMFVGFGISVGMIPLVSIISLGRICSLPIVHPAPYCHGMDQTKNQLHFWGVLISFVLDLIAVLTTAYRANRTASVLNRVPFIVARFDYLILRIVRMMTGVLFFGLLLLGVIYCATSNLLLTYDGYISLQSKYIFSDINLVSTGVSLWRFGFCIMLGVYEVSLSILFLPIDSVMIRSCLRAVPDRHKRVEFSIKETSMDVEQGNQKKFVSNPGKYVFDTQFLALQFSHMVYLTGVDNVSHNLLNGTNFRAIDHVFDAVTDTHVWVIESDDRIIVSFRGTVSAANAKTDLTLNLVPLTWKPLESKTVKGAEKPPEDSKSRDMQKFVEDESKTADDWWEEQIKQVQANQQNLKISNYIKYRTRIHSGFLIAWSTVQDRVVEHLLQLRKKDKERGLGYERTVHVTGHSLGGALATVCSLYLTSCLHFDVVCSTFGSPRVGNYPFRDYYEAYVPSTWRIITKYDPIPRTPSQTPLPGIGYTHVGRTVLLLLEGDMLVDPSIVEESLLVYCAKVRFSSHLLFEYITAMLRFTLSPRFQLCFAGLNDPESLREGIDDSKWEPYVPKMFTAVQDALFRNIGKLDRSNTVRNHFGDDKGKHQTLNDVELTEKEANLLKESVANMKNLNDVIEEEEEGDDNKETKEVENNSTQPNDVVVV